MIIRNRPYYGWFIAAVAVMANFMSVGSGFYALNAFLEPLSQWRGWSRTDINMALTVGTFFGFLAQFVYGTLVIRIGPRLLMSVGAFCAGMAFVFLFRMETLGTFYAVYALLFLFNGAYGGIVANTAVSNWFVKNRGKALGITTAGMSLSGAVLPFFAMLLIMAYGIGTASLVIGLLIALVSPLAWLVVRDWPERYGMLPDGAPPPIAPPVSGSTGAAIAFNAHRHHAAPDPAWRIGALIRTGAFWKIGLAYGMMMIGVVGVMSQLKPRFSDIGFGPMTAMGLMALTALTGTAGKYFLGALCDRFEPSRVGAGIAAAIAAGLAFGLFGKSTAWALVLFIVVFGFAMGGVMSTFPVIVADRFGREAFPLVFRYLYLFLILQMAGYLVSGLSYDLTGSYDTAYAAYIVLDIVAFGLLMRVAPPVREGR